MVQSLIGTSRVNGASASGEFFSKDVEFWTVETTLDIRPTGAVGPLETINPQKVFPMNVYEQTFSSESEYQTAYEAQKRFETLVNTISTRAQPIIIGQVVKETRTAPVSNLPVTSSQSGDVDVYVLKFAIDHAGAWDGVELTLADSLHNLNGFVYTVPTDDNNVDAYKNTLL